MLMVSFVLTCSGSDPGKVTPCLLALDYTAGPKLFGPGSSFVEDSFSWKTWMDWGGHGWRMVLELFKHIIFIVHFIPIIITSTPPQIIRH